MSNKPNKHKPVTFPGQAKQKSLKDAIKLVKRTLEELHNNVLLKGNR